MTRETKIGLLVGLAFIIVIGILLSDHLTSSTEPPPAQLTQAGSSVRGGTQVPNAEHVSLTQPVAPGPITPQGQVPTSYDLNPRPVGPVVQQIAIGGPAQGQMQEQSPTQLMQRQPQPGAVSPQQGTATLGANEVAAIYQPPANNSVRTALDTQGATVRYVGNEPLNSVAATAHREGEEIVAARSGAGGNTAEAHGQVAGREYRAVAGDNLSRLAAKMPGGSTKANRDAILAANPALKANPNVVIAGKTYILPTVGVSSPAPAPAAAAPAAATPVAAGPAAVPAAATNRQEHWYTVKEGDSLWRIASEQVGSAGAVERIKEMNKDSLKGGDVVRVGMKLRLPAKAMVAAAD